MEYSSGPPWPFLNPAFLAPSMPLPPTLPVRHPGMETHVLPPRRENNQAEREYKLQKRKQANRDSARRSKQRKKQENEELMVKSQDLKASHDALIRELSAGTERVRQLRTLNTDLRQQLQALGVQV